MENTELESNPIEGKMQSNEVVNLLYNNIFDKIPEPTLLIENDKIIRCNDAIVQLFGYTSKKEFTSKGLFELFPEQQLDGNSSEEKSLRYIHEALDKGTTTFEWIHKKKDGKQFYARIILLNLHIEGRKVIHAIVHDITEQKEIEISLRESEKKFKSLFEDNQSIILIIHPDTGNILDANPQACNFYRYSKKELLHMNISDINQLSSVEIQREMELAREEKRNYFNFKHKLSSGEIRNVEVYSGPIEIKNKKLLCSIIHDVTDKVNLLKQNHLFENIYNNTTEGIVVFDKKWHVKWVNEAFEKLSGYSKEELIGKDPHYLRVKNNDQYIYRNIAKSLPNHKTWQGEIILKHKRGQVIPSAITLTKIIEKDETVNYIATFTDITEYKQNQEKIEHLTFRDSLTELYNKSLFIEMLSYELKKDRLNEEFLAVLFITIDKFSIINHQFGYKVGDKILKNMADELNKIFLECDTIARYGAAEFIVLLPSIKKNKDVTDIAENVLKRIEHFCGNIEDRNIDLTISVGIAISQKQNITAEELINNAHVAMTEAKKDRKSSYRLFNAMMKENLKDTYIFENALSKALDDNQFF